MLGHQQLGSGNIPVTSPSNSPAASTAPPMRQASVTDFLAPLCERLIVTPLVDCGHYPMQEAPPLLVTTLERFLLR